MTVLRIVPNVSGAPLAELSAFYADLFGLQVRMDLDWVATLGADGATAPQINLLTDGGAGAPTPDLSIEVDDLPTVHQRAVDRGCAILHGPATESWGVRRFLLRDPAGRIVNVFSHVEGA